MPASLLPLLLLSASFSARAAESVPTLLEEPPKGITQASLLLCEGSACRSDGALAIRMGLAEDRPLVAWDALLALDSGGWVEGDNVKSNFGEALERAQTAAAAGRWSDVEAATDEALASLEQWSGTVETRSLFLVHFLRGAAQVNGGKHRGYEYSFREAASIVDGRAPDPLPITDVKASRAWIEELRKVTVTGRGTLVVQGIDPGVTVYVDGAPLTTGNSTLLLPGNHRITATRTDAIRTWKVQVPIFAERTSTVRVEFPEADLRTWITNRMGTVFDRYQAPEEVSGLLKGWCDRYGVTDLRILRVQDYEKVEDPIGVGLSFPPELRPKAAEGEEVDMGDGVPTTYEGQVMAEHTAPHESAAPEVERRVRVVYFDPATRRFHADALTVATLGVLEEPLLYLGVQGGYAGLLKHHHGALDLVVSGKMGVVEIEGRLGVARTQDAYNYYTNWQDRNLYHIYGGVRWNPLQTAIMPFVGGGPELYVPTAFGLRLNGGAQMRLMGNLRLAAEANLSALNRRIARGMGILGAWGL